MFSYYHARFTLRGVNQKRPLGFMPVTKRRPKVSTESTIAGDGAESDVHKFYKIFGGVIHWKEKKREIRRERGIPYISRRGKSLGRPKSLFHQKGKARKRISSLRGFVQSSPR